MRLKAHLAGIEHEVLLRLDGTQAESQIDDRPYKLEILSADQSVYLLRQGTKVYYCRVELARDGVVVHLRQREYSIRIIDPKRLATSQSATRSDQGMAQIVAAMPGRVVRVLAPEGTKVQAGTGIVVVEAMKMQNELKTPKGGTVVSIRAAAGETVNSGDVLAVIE